MNMFAENQKQRRNNCCEEGKIKLRSSWERAYERKVKTNKYRSFKAYTWQEMNYLGIAVRNLKWRNVVAFKFLRIRKVLARNDLIWRFLVNWRSKTKVSYQQVPGINSIHLQKYDNILSQGQTYNTKVS